MIVRPIETFPVTAFADEVLPAEIEGFKPGATFVRAVLDACPVVITSPLADTPLPFEQTDADDSKPQIAIDQVSSSHHRSFVITEPCAQEFWQDEFGNPYSHLNLKGNNFSSAHLIETATAAQGVIAYGLQESSAMLRVVRASRMMRERGIGTEYILGAAEPQKFRIPTHDHLTDIASHETLPVYKDHLVESHWLKMDPESRTPEALVELQRKFEHMTFVISMRAMDTGYRMHDLHKPEVRASVMELVNKNMLKEGQQPFDAYEETDNFRLADEIIIPNLGRNLARLHKAELCHRFPYSGNLTALGSIVDNDSVRGKTLEIGDDPITHEDMARDFLVAAKALSENSFVWQKTPGKWEAGKLAGTYLDEYLNEDATPEDYATMFAVFLAAVHLAKTSKRDDLMGQLAGINAHQLMTQFFERTFKTREDVLEKIAAGWLEQSGISEEQIDAAIRAKAQEDLPHIVHTIVNSNLNEPMSLRNLSDDTTSDTSIAILQDWLHEISLSAIMKELKPQIPTEDKPIEHIYFDSPIPGLNEEFNKPELLHLITVQLLGTARDYFGQLAFERMFIMVPEIEAHVCEAFKNTRSVSLVTGQEVRQIGHGVKNGFLYAMDAMPLDTFSELAVRAPDVTSVRFLNTDECLETEGMTRSFWFDGIEDATEVYSDMPIADYMVQYDDDNNIAEIALDLNEGNSYDAVLCEHEDGTKTLNVVLSDAALVEKLQTLDREAAFDMLSKYVKYRPALFDSTPYVEPRRNWHGLEQYVD